MNLRSLPRLAGLVAVLGLPRFAAYAVVGRPLHESEHGSAGHVLNRIEAPLEARVVQIQPLAHQLCERIFGSLSLDFLSLEVGGTTRRRHEHCGQRQPRHPRPRSASNRRERCAAEDDIHNVREHVAPMPQIAVLRGYYDTVASRPFVLISAFGFKGETHRIAPGFGGFGGGFGGVHRRSSGFGVSMGAVSRAGRVGCRDRHATRSTRARQHCGGRS